MSVISGTQGVVVLRPSTKGQRWYEYAYKIIKIKDNNVNNTHHVHRGATDNPGFQPQAQALLGHVLLQERQDERQHNLTYVEAIPVYPDTSTFF